MTKSAGVTLVELMVVVVILGILAAIAYPSYRQQVLRSHRSDAKIALEQAAQTLERCYTNNPTYTSCAPLDTMIAGTARPSENGYYSINFFSAPTAMSFTLQATAVGGQLDDSDCRVFRLDNINRRVAKNAADVDNAACWQR